MVIVVDYWVFSNYNSKTIRESFVEKFSSQFLGCLEESVAIFQTS